MENGTAADSRSSHALINGPGFLAGASRSTWASSLKTVRGERRVFSAAKRLLARKGQLCLPRGAQCMWRGRCLCIPLSAPICQKPVQQLLEKGTLSMQESQPSPTAVGHVKLFTVEVAQRLG